MGHQRTSGQLAKFRDAVQIWLARSAFIVMAMGSALAFALLDPPDNGVSGPWLLRLTAFVVLACLPTWLYVRFLGVKLSSVYTEYVLNLHRLLVDEPGNLPKPPYWSEYYVPWRRDRQRRHDEEHDARSGDAREDSVYEQKFQAYFGRRTDGKTQETTWSGLGSLLPVVVAWAMMAAGWLTILLDVGFIEHTTTGDIVLGDVLRFAFLGNYVFSLQLIVRAYFQNDLRSTTYVGVLERFAVVLVIIAMIHVVWSLLPGTASAAALEAAVAFVVGSFPLVGQQWLNQLVGKRMRTQVQALGTRHPLAHIDGMNVWYQARMLEEGIEDCQNLATANIVDVVLHSRAPVGRLVDWLDQALLLQHLPPWPDPKEPRNEPKLSEEDIRFMDALHALGVRSATDLLELYWPLAGGVSRQAGHTARPLWPKRQQEADFGRTMLQVVPVENERAIVEARLLSTLRVLSDEPNLKPVRNWQAGFADYHRDRVHHGKADPQCPSQIEPSGEAAPAPAQPAAASTPDSARQPG